MLILYAKPVSCQCEHIVGVGDVEGNSIYLPESSNLLRARLQGSLKCPKLGKSCSAEAFGKVNVANVGQ